MAWPTPQHWKDALADTWMLDWVRDTQVPESLEALWTDEGWYSIFYMYLQGEYSTETVDFIRCVEQFEQSGDLAFAAQVYTEFVAESAPRQVNISAAMRHELEAIFGEGGTEVGPPSLFDAAKAEILALIKRDTFNQRFRSEALAAEAALGAEVDWDAVGTRDRA